MAASPDVLTEQQMLELQAALHGAEAASAERRGAERLEYPVIQVAAPCFPRQPACRWRFSPIRCRNISRGGISFYWPRTPDFEDVLVVLGPRAEAIFVTARVAWFKRVEGSDTMFLVGCQFLQKLDPAEASGFRRPDLSMASDRC
jgi:hypothetical protein